MANNDTKKQKTIPEKQIEGKLMPQNVDAEKQLIGYLLNGLVKPYLVSPLLPVDAFYKLEHKTIYEAILAIAERGAQPDILTVTNYLRKSEKLDEVGGAYGVVTISNTSAGSGSSFMQEVLMIKEAHILREVITKSYELQGFCYEPKADFSEAVARLESFAASVSKMVVMGKAETAAKLFEKVLDDNKKIVDNGGVTGISTGFSDIDRIMSGMQPKDLILIAARPSMGKTALALSIFKNACLSGKRGLFFSIEMSNNKLYARIMSQVSGVPLSSIIMRGLANYEYQQILAKEHDLKSSNMYFDDEGSIKLVDLKAKARKLHREKKIDFIMVDYLQLIDNKRQGINREQEVSEISRGLKSLAKELDIPIVALAQLSRASEKRGTNHRPMLSDLRESGGLEQDADLVAFIHRPEYYGVTEDENGDSTIGLAEFIVSKNRNGPTGIVKMKFVKEQTEFQDLNKIEAPIHQHFQDTERDEEISMTSPF